MYTYMYIVYIYMYIILLTYVTNVVELQILIMSTITKDFPLWIVDSLENNYLFGMYLILNVRKYLHKIKHVGVVIYQSIGLVLSVATVDYWLLQIWFG